MVFQLSIEGLSVYMQIGVHGWEKAVKQKVLVDVNLSYLAKPGAIICYSSLKKLVIAAASEAHGHELLEDVAKDLVGCIVKDYPVVSECTVKLSKPTASCMQGGGTSVAVFWKAGSLSAPL
ncbi:dihydroneopterin aldolase [Anaplasma centrale str. Israel]|uniref:Dihydroneopterin aldolase n=1 Tax=Anaplasma centrale (strain Israel) TaxID=574556 RepID=D1AUS4_ANACI|nr:dihydroneopterin aldolase [Anaplasma centrale]ACZ49302.1 dihydroneopterin aldolase [Anaplasma centrale str. Israel]